MWRLLFEIYTGKLTCSLILGVRVHTRHSEGDVGGAAVHDVQQQRHQRRGRLHRVDGRHPHRRRAKREALEADAPQSAGGRLLDGSGKPPIGGG